MVRKVMSGMFVLVLIFAFGVSAQATSYSAYDGTISTTYVTYFKDIVSGIGFKDNYVAFRSDQYTYKMIVGDIEYNSGVFSLVGNGTEYTIEISSGYNSGYTYTAESCNGHTVKAGNEIVYSDLGSYPQLVERGAKYEMLSAVLLVVLMLGFVLRVFFVHR